MKKCANVFWGLVVCLIFAGSVRAEAIYHEKFYPDGSGPFPAVIALHTSGGLLLRRSQLLLGRCQQKSNKLPNLKKR